MGRMSAACFIVAMIHSQFIVHAAETGTFQINPAIREILENYCIDCHEEGTDKGKFIMPLSESTRFWRSLSPFFEPTVAGIFFAFRSGTKSAHAVNNGLE
jgi:hypothetical protein